jgi:hypothetical protein
MFFFSIYFRAFKILPNVGVELAIPQEIQEGCLIADCDNGVPVISDYWGCIPVPCDATGLVPIVAGPSALSLIAVVISMFSYRVACALLLFLFVSCCFSMRTADFCWISLGKTGFQFLTSFGKTGHFGDQYFQELNRLFLD